MSQPQPEQNNTPIPNTLGDYMALINKTMAEMNDLYSDSLNHIRTLMGDNDNLDAKVKELESKLNKANKKK